MFRTIIIFIVFLIGALRAFSQELPKPTLFQLQEQLKKSNRDTSRVNIQIALGRYYLLRPARQQADIDSAFFYCKSSEILSNNLYFPKGTGNSNLLRSQILFAKREIVAANYYATLAIEIFKTNNLFADLGEACFELSSHYSLEEKDIIERIRLITIALAAFQQTGVKEKIAYSFRELADLHKCQGNIEEAFKEITECVSIYEAINYPYIYGAYDLESEILYLMADYKQSLKYSLLAVQKIEESGDSSLQLATAYNRAAVIHFVLQQYRQAETFYTKSLSIAEKFHDSTTVRIVTRNLVYNFLVLKKFNAALNCLKEVKGYFDNSIIGDKLHFTANSLSAYMGLDQLDNAAAQYVKLSELFKQTKLSEDTLIYYETAIQYFFKTRQYNKVYEYLPVNQAYMQRMHWDSTIPDNEQAWYRTDSATGNFRGAFQHYLAFRKITDSMSTATNNRQIHQLQVEFDVEKKDKDIKLKGRDITILKKQSQLQETKLSRANAFRNFILIALGLLLIIVALLFNRTRLKQRANEKLEQKQFEINEQNVSLQHLLNEKSWLLKEIHHRVKNNLQIVMSLLNSQSAYLENNAAIDAIRDSQNRVQTMSLIHQKLYLSDNVSSIHMDTYISELVASLQDCYNTGRRIRFNLDIEKISLDVSQAVPLGLILNEAITNCIKYAFPEEEEAIVHISLKNISKDRLLLYIADNGTGIQITEGKNKAGSLGMSLMRGLSEDIDGKFSIENNNGTVISLEFVPERSIHTAML